jgi:ribosomal protein S18 acetylase RimI-like enzyme
MEKIKIENPKVSECLSIKLIAIRCLPLDITSYLPFLHLFQTSLLSKEMLVARSNKKIIGFLSTFTLFSKTNAFMLQFCVSPEYRGKGIGGMLMAKLVELLKYRGYKKVVLRVRIKNKNAISLYERFGFKKIKKIFFDSRYLMEKEI